MTETYSDSTHTTMHIVVSFLISSLTFSVFLKKLSYVQRKEHVIYKVNAETKCNRT